MCACRPVGNFKSSREYHYQALKMNVDMLKASLSRRAQDLHGPIRAWDGNV